MRSYDRRKLMKDSINLKVYYFFLTVHGLWVVWVMGQYEVNLIFSLLSGFSFGHIGMQGSHRLE